MVERAYLHCTHISKGRIVAKHLHVDEANEELLEAFLGVGQARSAGW